MSKFYHATIRRDWAEKIANAIWEYIKDDFSFDPATCYREEQIDENLWNIFKQMKSFQSTILF